MHEYKFRAWDITKRIYIYDHDMWSPDPSSEAFPKKIVNVTSSCIIYEQTTTNTDFINLHGHGRVRSYYSDWDHIRLFSTGFIFEPYTGRMDKNKTTIYLGDVIQLPNLNFGYGDPSVREFYYAKVTYSESDAAFLLGDNNLGEYANQSMIVSGNIHENFSLLELSKKG